MIFHPHLLEIGNNESFVAVLGILLPIIITIATLFLIFGLEYLRFKDRQAMLEKGLDPGPFRNKLKPVNGAPIGITIAMGLIGFGIGLLIAFYLTNTLNFKEDTDPIYFGCIGIFGGLGLLSSYFLSQKLVSNTEKITGDN